MDPKIAPGGDAASLRGPFVLRDGPTQLPMLPRLPKPWPGRKRKTFLPRHAFSRPGQRTPAFLEKEPSVGGKVTVKRTGCRDSHGRGRPSSGAAAATPRPPLAGGLDDPDAGTLPPGTSAAETSTTETPRLPVAGDLAGPDTGPSRPGALAPRASPPGASVTGTSTAETPRLPVAGDLEESDTGTWREASSTSGASQGGEDAGASPAGRSGGETSTAGTPPLLVPGDYLEESDAATSTEGSSTSGASQGGEDPPSPVLSVLNGASEADSLSKGPDAGPGTSLPESPGGAPGSHVQRRAESPVLGLLNTGAILEPGSFAEGPKEFTGAGTGTSRPESTGGGLGSYSKPKAESPVWALLSAALSVGAGASISKVLGLGREAALAAAFGVGPVMTAYTYSSLLPSFFLSLLGGVNGPFHSAIAASLSITSANKPLQNSNSSSNSNSANSNSGNSIRSNSHSPINSNVSTDSNSKSNSNSPVKGSHPIDSNRRAPGSAKRSGESQAQERGASVSDTGEDEDARLVALVAGLSVAAALVASALLFLNAPSIVEALAPGLRPASQGPVGLSGAELAMGVAELATGRGAELALAAGQLRLMLPCLVASPLLGIFFGVLSARGEYFLPSLAPSISSVSLLLSLLLYSATLPLVQQQYRLANGATMIAVGTTLGALGQLALVLYALERTSPEQGSNSKPRLGLLTKGPLTLKSIWATLTLPSLPALRLRLAQALGVLQATVSSLPGSTRGTWGSTLRGALGALAASKTRLVQVLTVLLPATVSSGVEFIRGALGALTVLKPRLVQVLRVLLPATVSSGLLQIATYTDLHFASFQPGAAAALGYANLLAMAPIGILSTSLLVPALPMFSQISNPENWPELRLKVRDSVLLCLAITLPLVSVGAPLAYPLVSCAFQRKSFDAAATRLVSSLFSAYVCGAPAYVTRDVLVRVFYGLGDGATPFYVSLFAILANAVLDPLFFGALKLGAPGLVWATVAVNTLSAVALFLSLQKLLGGLVEQEWGKPLTGLAVAAATSMYTCLWLLRNTPSPHGILGTGVAGAGGCVVYAAVCLMFGLDHGVLGQALRFPRLKEMLHM